MNRLKVISLSCIALGLTACSTLNSPMPARAPVADSGQPNQPSTPSVGVPQTLAVGVNQYEVQKGDTLFSISKKLAIPMQKLADLNHLSAPYAIQLGQRLSLGATNNTAKTNAAPTNNPSASNQDAQVVTSPIRAEGAVVTGAVATEQSKPPAESNGIESVPDQALKWYWPLKGKVSAGFDGQTNKGLNLTASSGETILAAAAGKVIYSGMDIRGTGKLAIVKHNSNYLSVYAHQGVNLLKEGEMVAAGDKLATLPVSAAPVLHFEIRLKGKPIDPAGLLGNP